MSGMDRIAMSAKGFGKMGIGTMGRTQTFVKTGLSLMLAGALSACVSLGGGGDPPDMLLTLTSSSVAPAGQSASGTLDDALAVITPEAPLRLDVTRIPVQVDESNVAYLKDAVWVDKPARLFARLLSETLRAKQTHMIVEGADMQYGAATKLTGQLIDMGYDATLSAVVVRFDAVLRKADGSVTTQRFESEVDGVLPEARYVGPALNDAANDVAVQVAEWVG